MSFKDQLKKIGKNVEFEIRVYKAVIKDKRTPVLGKILLGMAVGYFFLPFDLIPDFIPILGQLDDLVIIPALIVIALRIIPEEIMEKHSNKFRITN